MDDYDEKPSPWLSPSKAEKYKEYLVYYVFRVAGKQHHGHMVAFQDRDGRWSEAIQGDEVEVNGVKINAIMEIPE